MSHMIIWINKDDTIDEEKLWNYEATPDKIMEKTGRSIILNYDETHIIKVAMNVMTELNEIDSIVKFQGHPNIIKLHCIMCSEKLNNSLKIIHPKDRFCCYAMLMERGIILNRK